MEVEVSFEDSASNSSISEVSWQQRRQFVNQYCRDPLILGY